MSSAAKMAANQRNAQLSSGPQSEQGKARSRMNATRHGLTGQVLILPAEDMEAYQALSAGLHTELKPQGLLETQLVQRLSDTLWRLNTIPAREAALLALGQFESRLKLDSGHAQINTTLAYALALRENNEAIANYALYEQRLNRVYERTMKQLRDVQTERRQAEPQPASDLPEAVETEIYNTSGFVFSPAEMEREPGVRKRDLGSEPSLNPTLHSVKNTKSD